MTEKDILYRCEQNFLNPDDEKGHVVVCGECTGCDDLYKSDDEFFCGDCGGSKDLCIFDDEILCADCIEARLVQTNDDCVADFLEENHEKFREFIWDYFGHVAEK